MQITVEQEHGNVKAVKIEYTPVEALVVNYALRRHADADDINPIDRDIARRMLEVQPTFKEIEE